MDWEHMVFRSVESREFRRLRGFDRTKGHFIPKFKTSAAQRFLVRLMRDELEEERAEVRDGLRQMTGLSSSQMTLDEPDEGVWTLDTPGFSYRIQVSQEDERPDRAEVVREWSLGPEWQSLPREVGQLFLSPAEYLVLPLPSRVDLEGWVSHFEGMMRRDGGELEQRPEWLVYRPGKGGEMRVDFDSGEWRVTPPRVSGFLEMARWIQGRADALPA